MESAPLTLAYTHARNAAAETKRRNPVAASEEHDLAAAEFAAAAQTTKDQEALRMLKLLEEHHKLLGNILKGVSSNPVKADSPTAHAFSASSVSRNPYLAEAEATKPSPTELTPPPPRLAPTARSSARDLSSSIAANLATARGIPSRQSRVTPVSPLVSNEHAGGRFAQDRGSRVPSRPEPEANKGRVDASRPSWTPPTDVGAAVADKVRAASDAAYNDAPFQQFYNVFEGLMSKISAPLAFASLPLTGYAASGEEDKTKTASANSNAANPRQPAPKGPRLDASVDYSQLISKAALDAVGAHPNHSLNDSYMYVPGARPYAEVARNSHRRQPSNLSDDFVDASSQILPSPTTATPKGPRQSRPQDTYRGKTLEELYLENVTLKDTVNKTSQQLHMFQMSAQTSSAVLAQSIRSFAHLSPVTTPENSRGRSAQAPPGPNAVESLIAQKRIAELEEMVKKYDRKLAKREDENAKLKDTLGKYREKWDSLKAGAKARRDQATATKGDRRSDAGTADRRQSKDTAMGEEASAAARDESMR